LATRRYLAPVRPRFNFEALGDERETCQHRGDDGAVKPTVGANDIKVDDITSVVFLQAYGRLPSDVGSEVVDVLGDVCRVVVCDLSGMAAAGVGSVLDAFAPASHYLRIWPGTALVAYAPEDSVREVLAQALVGERIVVPASMAAGEAQAFALLPRLQSVSMLLPPWPKSAAQARRVVRRALAEWELGDLDDAAALVTTELVSNAVVHAQTLLHLTLVRAGSQVRLAVRDRGGGYAASDPDLPYASSLHGRGLALVESCTQDWGVLPARRLGKTVWAVLENCYEPVPAAEGAGG
jgi:anti-sigma regulatory factor (Ser/Thr protein kinase)